MSIGIPIVLLIPVAVWLVTYVLTKYHGIKGFLKECTDFYM